MMKNLIKILVSIALISVFVMNCCFSVFAKEDTSLSNETIEKMMQNDFADDSVIVVFEQKPSIEYQTISLDMFKEIDGETIFNLSSAIESKLRTAISNGMAQITAGETPTIDSNLDFSGFNSIVSIKLAEPGKENVIKAINALRARDDVKYAGPNYIIRQDIIVEENTENSGVSYTPTSTINDLLDLESAWAAAEYTCVNSFRVAVIDSGIDTSHPLLNLSTQTDILWADYSEYYDIPGKVVYGRPKENDEYINYDKTGRGTHVAGIISSVVDENFWVVDNSNQFIDIISVRIFDATGTAHTSELIAAINYVNESNKF